MKKEEDAYQDILDGSKDLFSDDCGEKILHDMIKMIEDMQQRSFMDGYKYAISILKESMADKND